MFNLEALVGLPGFYLFEICSLEHMFCVRVPHLAEVCSLSRAGSHVHRWDRRVMRVRHEGAGDLSTLEVETRERCCHG